MVLASLQTSFLPRLNSQEVINAASLASTDRGAVFQARYFSNQIEASPAGDVDRDGFDDLLFMVNDDCSEGEGRWTGILVYGRPGLTGLHHLDCNFPHSARFRLKADLRHEEMHVFPAGDLDADGYCDFLFSFPYVRATGPVNDHVGYAYLVLGGKRIEGERFGEEIGTSLPGKFFYSSDPLESRLGVSAANIGDFDGDGKDDLAVGCSSSTVKGRERVGRVYIVLKLMELPSNVDLTQVGLSIPGVQVDGAQYLTVKGQLVGSLGGDLRAIGDMNRDGFYDVILKATGSHYYLTFGSASPPGMLDMMETVNGGSLEGVTLLSWPDESAGFTRTSQIGDVDADGYPDILFGVSSTYDPLFPKPKAVYLVYGKRIWPGEVRVQDLPPESSTKYLPYDPSSFARALAAAGDLNADGVPDFLIGADRAGLDSEGEAYAVFGNREHPGEVDLSSGFAGIRVVGETPLGWLGYEVSPAGDFNGDGALDFVVGAPKVDPDGSGEVRWSRFYLIYGTGGRPQPLRLLGNDPAWGPIKGGTTVEIRGTGFRGTPKVSFGAGAAESVQVFSEFLLRAVTPSGMTVGPVDIEVTADGQTQRLLDAFEYTPNFPEVKLGSLGPSGLVLEGRSSDRLGDAGRVAFGDLTGDGLDELVVAVSFGKSIEVAVVKGAVDLPERMPAFTPSQRVTVVRGREDAAAQVRGTTVSVLGDVNGDGLKDLGIARVESFAYILFGRREFPEEIDLDLAVGDDKAVNVLSGQNPTGSYSFVAMGDLTGDGLGDFAIGFSQGLTDGETRLQLEGEILFVKGRTDWPRDFDLGDPTNVFSRIRGSKAGYALAKTMAPAGDVNGDGLQDLLADAGQGSSDLFTNHYAFVIYGKGDLPEVADVESHVAQGGGVRIQPPAPHPFGSLFNTFNLAGLGDVNGDGFADIVIGQGGGGQQYQGATYLLFGGPAMPASIQVLDRPTEPDGIVRIFGEASNRNAGVVGVAGDFDADGFRDFLIGEKGYQDPAGKAGNVFLILGRPKFPERIELARIGGRGIKIESRSPRWGIGIRVGPFGDLNGDGKSDFALGEVYRFTGEGEPVPDESYLDVVYGPTGSRRFIRGDANEDTAVDLSDAVSILAHLFLGGEAPCDRRPLDADDNATIEITDAVYLLGYLFLGQPPPPAPFPNLGIDATQDELGCKF